MNAILDLVIVIIASLTIYFAYKRGFIKTLLSASSFLIAIVLTVLFLSPVKTALANTSLAADVRTRVETEINGIIDTNGIKDVEELISKDSKIGEFANILEKVGLNKEDLNVKFDEWKAESSAQTSLREKLVDYIADPVVDAIITAASIVLIFFGSIILLKITAYILDKVCKLPILKTANKLLGVLMGVVLALVRIYLFVILMKILIPNGDALGIEMLSDINPDKTLLFKLFYDFNIFQFLR
jgi:uncharacterized membrane protein required for colicin V production